MNIENANKALDYLERVLPLIGAEIERLAETTDLDAACAACAAIRGLKDRADEVGSSIRAIEKTLTAEIIPLQFDATGTQSPYRHVSGTFTRTMKVSASILKGRKAEAWAWLKRNKLGGLIIQTVNAQTLGATAKQLLEKGKELPDDLFTVSLYSYIAYTTPKEDA